MAKAAKVCTMAVGEIAHECLLSSHEFNVSDK